MSEQADEGTKAEAVHPLVAEEERPHVVGLHPERVKRVKALASWNVYTDLDLCLRFNITPQQLQAITGVEK